jgi:exodeoxyribonuclease VII large subunit
MMAFERLKAKLSEEGLFAPEHKKPIPRFPWRIGIVTSPTGAALRDIVSICRRRNPVVELILAPVKVQGEGAAEEIARAIKMFNRYKEVDLLIVGRGGGSLEDLWPFNEEVVARAIYGSELPVISAVGHEVDFSISDMVADLRAPTPSAAVELAVPEAKEILAGLKESLFRMKSTMLNRVNTLRQRLDWARKSRAFHRPRELFREYSQRLDEARRRMDSIRLVTLEKGRNRLTQLKASMKALDPMGVLQRGYSICRKLPEGVVITDGGTLHRGELLALTFAKGGAIGKVEKVEGFKLGL